MYSFDRLMRESREAKLKVQIFNDWITASEFYSDLTQKRVKKLCDFVAGFLEIDLPEIRFIDTFEGYEKASGMTIFKRDKYGELRVSHILFLKKHLKYFDEYERKSFLATIAHELRHVWQFENNIIDLFKLENDNTGADEIDAGAFSMLFLEFFLGAGIEADDKKLNALLIERENEIYEEFLYRITDYRCQPIYLMRKADSSGR